MIIKSLYESLVNSLNEVRIQRTIDKKLWLSIASTISRNRSSEAEFIKPIGSDKDILLQKYVAALLILKKRCPESEDDMDDIKTFKLVGHKLLDLGVTFNEIKDLYVKNGGTQVSNTISVNPTTEVNKMEKEIKENPEVQVDDSDMIDLLNKKQKAKDKSRKSESYIKFNKQLYGNCTSYDDFKKINDKLSLKDLILNTYNIIDTTYYKLKKTFYKIVEKDYKVYFRDVYTDDDDRIYRNDYKALYISWVYIRKSKVEDNTFAIRVNDFTINGEPIRYNIELNNKVSIDKDELHDILSTALSKLQYVQQSEYTDLLSNGDKKYMQSLGSFENYGKHNELNRDYKYTPLYKKIFQYVQKQYTTNKVCTDCIRNLICKLNLGNEDNGKTLETPLNVPIATLKIKKYTDDYYERKHHYKLIKKDILIDIIKIENYSSHSKNCNEFNLYYRSINQDVDLKNDIIHSWHITNRDNPINVYYNFMSSPKYEYMIDSCNEIQILKMLQHCIATIYYYNNNVSALIK